MIYDVEKPPVFRERIKANPCLQAKYRDLYVDPQHFLDMDSILWRNVDWALEHEDVKSIQVLISFLLMEWFADGLNILLLEQLLAHYRDKIDLNFDLIYCFYFNKEPQNSKESQDITPLVYAIREASCVKLPKLLIEHGANIDKTVLREVDEHLNHCINTGDLDQFREFSDFFRCRAH